MDSGVGNVVIGGRMLYYRSGACPKPQRRLKIKSTEPSKKAEKEKTEEEETVSRDLVLTYRPKPTIAGINPKQLRQLRKELRNNLPLLTDREIRRNRLAYYEAMYLELEEDGFQEAAQYVQQLINLNDQLRESGGENSIIWHRPLLKNNRLYLDRLRTGLVEAEKARMEGDLGAECSAFLYMAIFFMSKRDAWWWVAEQLFLHCVQVASLYRGDGGWREACSRYLYGKFLQEQLTDYDESKKQLQLARDLSTGKDWSAEKELGTSQGTIYLESCTLLYQALLKIGIQIRSTDPNRSVRLCNQALRRSMETHKIESEAEVLLELGISYQVAGEYTHALQTLNQYLALSKTLDDVEGQCSAYLEFALCYKALNDNESTLQNLELLLEVAEKHQRQELTAAAHRYLGECYLNKGLPDEAVTHLVSAFSTYFQLQLTREVEQTRTLAAIAAGQEILPCMIDLILSCDDENQSNLTRLINWKDRHIPFWEADQDSLSPRSSEVDISPQYEHASISEESVLIKSEQATSSEDSVLIENGQATPSEDSVLIKNEDMETY